VRTTLASQKFRWAASLCMLTLMSGCQHVAGRGGAHPPHSTPSTTAEDLFEIGLLQARQGDLLRAEQYLSAARNLGFDEPTVVYWLVRVCVAAGRYQSALDHAARYARDNPANWRLRLVVASIYEALGDLERARLELEHIVTAQPASPLIRYRLGMLYLRESPEVRRATGQLEAYLALDPEGAHAAEVEFLLARAREPAGRPRPAPSASASGAGRSEVLP